MFSITRTRTSAGRLGAYGFTVLAIGLALWAALLMARTSARPLAATPFALAIALSAGYGGLGPGLFALVQAALAIDFFLMEPGTFFQAISPAQTTALIAFVGGWSVFSFLAGGAVRREDQIRQARVTAESASAHAARMTQLTSALAQARTPRAAIEAAVQESLYALRADAGALLLVAADGQTGEVARAVGYPLGRAPTIVSLSQKGPVSDAVGRDAAAFSGSGAPLPRSACPSCHPDCLIDGDRLRAHAALQPALPALHP